ncbi:MAG: hypothetical protein ACEPO8_06590 [Rhodothermaceae bacterium]
MKTLIKISLLLILVSCSDLKENITEPVKRVNIHKEGINDKNSPNFHGKLTAEQPNKMEFCQSCHAGNFQGGTAKVSCTNCHQSIDLHARNSEISHINYLRENNWQLGSCKMCHGSNYAGGSASPTCLTCHNLQDGPENCSTCHFDNNLKPATGFHKMHLSATKGLDTECSVCHNVPETFSAFGHIDDTEGAEIILSSLALTATNEDFTEYYDSTLPVIAPKGVYNKYDKSCSNVYCHGYFKNGNLYNRVKTTDQFVCGSCHGDPATNNPLPKGNHPKSENCYLCHSTVDIDRNFIKADQHINGKLNVFGQEKNF